MISSGIPADDKVIHIECHCEECKELRTQRTRYGTYAWYRFHCHQLAEAEWKAHDNKRLDYIGDSDNIFWMFDDITSCTNQDFETVWQIWAARHWRALIRAMSQGNYKQASRRALDLMGWLFLLLAKYKPKT